ncbi:unnamed protein product [Brassica rapa subsp. narinosa]
MKVAAGFNSPTRDMLSPTLFPLFCVLFLCFPVAVIFTVQREITAAVSPELGFHSRNLHASTPAVRFRQQIPKDDEQLLRLASRVNPNQPSPGSIRKLAFMYLTTSPLPFAPLWEAFFNGSSEELYNVYVHADPTREYDPPFSGVFENRVWLEPCCLMTRHVVREWFSDGFVVNLDVVLVLLFWSRSRKK